MIKNHLTNPVHHLGTENLIPSDNPIIRGLFLTSGQWAEPCSIYGFMPQWLSAHLDLLVYSKDAACWKVLCAKVLHRDKNRLFICLYAVPITIVQPNKPIQQRRN